MKLIKKRIKTCHTRCDTNCPFLDEVLAEDPATRFLEDNILTRDGKDYSAVCNLFGKVLTPGLFNDVTEDMPMYDSKKTDIEVDRRIKEYLISNPEAYIPKLVNDISHELYQAWEAAYAKWAETNCFAYVRCNACVKYRGE